MHLEADKRTADFLDREIAFLMRMKLEKKNVVQEEIVPGSS